VSVPARDTVAGRAYRDLQNKARRESRPTEELLSLYTLEGFLDRLVVSARSREFVLKGGVLLAAYDLRRPTRDVDLQASAMANDAATVLALVTEIAGIERDDGLVYATGQATAETIRERDEYSGVRVSMGATLATAQLRFNVDVNVGDPVSPAAQLVEVPKLLGGSISVRGYPLVMVFAEKIVTAVQRGTANTRWRDFADIYLLSRVHAVDGTVLAHSLAVVAGHRAAELAPLAEVLAGFPGLAQTPWAAWSRKQRLTDRLPTQFGEVLDAVTAFTDPVLRGQIEGQHWDPSQSGWRVRPLADS
jgi:Nucleotidyl transferase AbiEii toxin, Type IV TA system